MEHCLPLWERTTSPECRSRDHSKHFRYFFFILFSFLSTALFAQTVVTGRVLTGDTAVSGATVQVKGTTTATQTNESGRFSISAPSNGTLVISSVGFASQELPVNNRTSFEVRLVAN